MWLDVCKGIGILLVVLGHCGGPFHKLIYGFHMPMFFIISGYLFRPKSKAVKHYAERYIVPYIILCCINLALELSQDIIKGLGFSKLKTYLFGIAFVKPSVQWMPNCTPLWFLVCLAISLTIYNAVFKIIDAHLLGLGVRRTNVVRFAFVLLLMSAGYFLYILDCPKLPWTLDTALMVPLFLEIGYQIKQVHNKLDKISQPIVLCLVGVIGIVCIIANPTEIDFAARTYGDLVFMLLGSVLTSCAVMWTCRLWCTAKENYIPGSKEVTRILAWFGQHTVFFMGFDYFSGNIARFALNLMGVNNWLTLFVGKVMFLVVGCVIWNKAIVAFPQNVRKRLLY